MACKNTIDKKIVRSLPKTGIKLPKPARKPNLPKTGIKLPKPARKPKVKKFY